MGWRKLTEIVPSEDGRHPSEEHFGPGMESSRVELGGLGVLQIDPPKEFPTLKLGSRILSCSRSSLIRPSFGLEHPGSRLGRLASNQSGSE